MDQQLWTAVAPKLIANATSSATLSGALPVDLSSLFRILTSFSASREGLIVMAIGLFQFFRRFSFNWTTQLYNKLFLRLSFDEQQPCYQWMLVWLSKQPMWVKSRDIQIHDRTGGIKWGCLGYDDPNADQELRDLSYLPTMGVKPDSNRRNTEDSSESPYSTWFKGHYLTIEHFRVGERWWGTNIIQISILGRNHQVLKDLLEEARKEYLTCRASRTDVYTTNDIESKYHCWQLTSSGPKRGLNSIILEPGLKSFLLKNAQNFLKSKQWYADRGIPFRRGYLLYGAPGSGKTSFISALAGELGLDIYSISLSHKGLDDTSLAKLLNKLPERCIALIEDIDAALTTSLNRDQNDDKSESDKDKKSKSTARASESSLGNVTLSGLLNALDGVGAKQGRILVATTNKYDSLDEALSRPGRMDVHIEFKLAAKYQARELFIRFYNPHYAADSDNLETTTTTTTNAVEEWETSRESTVIPSSVTVVGELSDDVELRIPMPELRKLADAFADVVPEHEVSMASLQGYLMEYKTSPGAALAGIKAWVEKQKCGPTINPADGRTALGAGSQALKESEADQ
ncbi:P-loop containing nucleoside triphosphate hydrolase protein [Hymenopellis radicata]|nr:P-loop containing nucleoside triphosphate hydrolase protein [Hymenopellis radicata]